MMRMPIFTWTTLITQILIVLAFPAITVALILLTFDRYAGTSFYAHRRRRRSAPLAAPLLGLRPPRGLHPDPAGLRHRLRDHPGLLAQAALRLRGHGLRARRDRLPRLRRLGRTTCSPPASARPPTRSSPASTMLIAIPTGVKIFNWIGTMFGGSLKFTTPMLFAIGFVSQFTIGGTLRRHARLAAGRQPAQRHLLRRRALPLRALRRQHLRSAGRHLLLVPEDDRAG